MLQAIHRRKTGGFTLIELLVTTAITAIILLTASTMLMTFFLSNTRTTIRRQIKAEGNRAMSRIEFVARGAQSCDDSTPQHLIFTDLNSETYNFYLDTTTNKLMLVYTEGGIPKAPEVLTDVYTITLNNFSCDSPVDSDKVYANIKFTLVSSETTTINESFTSLVVLRNSGN